MPNNVGLTFGVGDIAPQFEIRIGDNKYHV
jgi:hypothetical protein